MVLVVENVVFSVELVDCVADDAHSSYPSALSAATLNSSKSMFIMLMLPMRLRTSKQPFLYHHVQLLYCFLERKVTVLLQHVSIAHYAECCTSYHHHHQL